jgi:hypothetical protein
MSRNSKAGPAERVQLAACFCRSLAWLAVRPWRSRWCVPLKRRAVSELHGVTIIFSHFRTLYWSHKLFVNLDIIIAVKEMYSPAGCISQGNSCGCRTYTDEKWTLGGKVSNNLTVSKVDEQINFIFKYHNNNNCKSRDTNQCHLTMK